MSINNILFLKMHACGNDFILIDEIRSNGNLSEEIRQRVSRLCERRFCVGANGVLLISRSNVANVRMRIMESNGSESDMCGNGARCVARYLMERCGFGSPVSIETRGGVIDVERRSNLFRVNMGKVGRIAQNNGHYEINTGEPHLVSFVNNLDQLGVVNRARSMRNGRNVNVNFVETNGGNKIRVRTYERGVEDETLSCGTGATASAIVSSRVHGLFMPITVETGGGTLLIGLQNGHVFLEGPAEFVFEGVIQSCNIRSGGSNV